MQRSDAEKLRRYRVQLVGEIDALHLIDFLYQEGILTTDDCERIRSKVTTAEKVRALLDILPSRGPHVFNIFLASLRANGYGSLADQLQNSA